MKNPNLIAINGEIGSGKDTVTKIFQILAMFPKMTTDNVVKNLNKEFSNHIYENKKFAEKVKQILCIITGCSREDLESQEFKNKPIGPQWDRYAYFREGTRKPLRIYPTIEEAEKQIKIFGGKGRIEKIEMTYRLALQLIGTDLFRDMFHGNTWVNALFSEYTPHSKWIISDMRFPNEFESDFSRNGYTLKIIRLKPSVEWLGDFPRIKILNPDGWDKKDFDFSFYQEKITKGEFKRRLIQSTIKGRGSNKPSEIVKQISTHLSEIALETETRFDFTILNHGSLEDLVEKVRVIYNLIYKFD